MIVVCPRHGRGGRNTQLAPTGVSRGPLRCAEERDVARPPARDHGFPRTTIVLASPAAVAAGGVSDRTGTSLCTRRLSTDGFAEGRTLLTTTSGAERVSMSSISRYVGTFHRSSTSARLARCASRRRCTRTSPGGGWRSEGSDPPASHVRRSRIAGAPDSRDQHRPRRHPARGQLAEHLVDLMPADDRCERSGAFREPRGRGPDPRPTCCPTQLSGRPSRPRRRGDSRDAGTPRTIRPPGLVTRTASATASADGANTIVESRTPSGSADP